MEVFESRRLLAGDLTIDTSFGNQGTATYGLFSHPELNDAATDSLIQSEDGKMLVAVEHAVLRYKPNGGVDTSFGDLGAVKLPIDTPQLLRQTDGKFLVIGSTTENQFQNERRMIVGRLNTDGSLDQTYGSGGFAIGDIFIRDAGINAIDGAALDSNGSLFVLVAPNRDTAAQLGLSSFVVKLGSNGLPAAGFGSAGRLTLSPGVDYDQGDLAIQNDKILLLGEQGTSDTQFVVRRLDSAGVIDAGFGSSGSTVVQVAAFVDDPNKLAVQSDGKILVGGSTYDSAGATSAYAIARLQSNGQIDSSYGVGGVRTIKFIDGKDLLNDLAVVADGSVVATGRAITGQGKSYFATTRLTSSGALDSTFGQITTEAQYRPSFPSTPFRNSGASSVVINGNRIFVVGGLDFDATGSGLAMVAYQPNGALDTTFRPLANGNPWSTIVQSSGEMATSIANTPDGKYVVAGVSYGALLANEVFVTRINTDGTPDASFSGDGKLSSKFDGGVQGLGYGTPKVVVQPDGKIVVAGGLGDFQFFVARWNVDGSVDTSFGNNGVITEFFSPFATLTSNDIALQSDGKILVSLKFGTAYSIRRYNTNGSIDSTFSGGLVTTGFNGGNNSQLAIQPDGKIVIAGTKVVNGREQFAVERFLIDGTRDAAFNNNAVTTLSGNSNRANGMTLDTAGNIFVTGTNSFNTVGVAKFSATGVLDNTFNAATVTFPLAHDYSGNAITVMPNGKIVVVGEANFDGNRDFDSLVIVYESNGSISTTDNVVVSDYNHRENRLFDVVQSPNGKIVAVGVGWVTNTAGGASETLSDFLVSGFSSIQPGSVIVEPATVLLTSESGQTASFTVRLGSQPTANVTLTVQSNDTSEATTSVSQLTFTTGNWNVPQTVTISGIDDFLLDGDVSYSIVLGATASSDPAYNGIDAADVVGVNADNDANLPPVQDRPLGTHDIVKGVPFQITFPSDTFRDPDAPVGSSLNYSLASTTPSALPAWLSINSATRTISGTVPTNFAIGVFGVLVVARDSGSAIDPLQKSVAGLLSLNIQAPPPALFVSSSNFHESGVFSMDESVLRVDFNLAAAGASDPANYELQRAGVDGLLGTDDDQSIEFSSAGLNGTTATFEVKLDTIGRLPEDIYRFTLRDNITGPNGQRLDGDGNGIAGGDWVKDFVVVAATVQLDTSFDGDGKVTTSFGTNTASAARSSFVQSDGKLVVAGVSNNSFAIARYNPDGSLDTTFDGDGKVTSSFGATNRYSTINSVKVQDDGKIVVVGEYEVSLGTSTFALARYNSDGSLDTTFGVGGKQISDFGFDQAEVGDFEILSDGKLIVGGTRAIFGLGWQFILAKYTSSGMLDTTYGPEQNGLIVTPFFSATDVNSLLHEIDVDDEGKIVAVGYANGSDLAIVRYNSDGSLDTSFSNDGQLITDIGNRNDVAHSVAIQSDGKIVVAGSSVIKVGAGERTHFALVRYNFDGSLDTTFNSTGIAITTIGAYSEAWSLELQTDGKIVVVGSTNRTAFETDSDFAVLRFNTDGSLDNSFDGDGKLTIDFGGANETAFSTVIQSDGSIFVTGVRDFSIAIAKLKASPMGAVFTAPSGYVFDVDTLQFGAGQLLQGPTNAFDGLNRLWVDGSDYAPSSSGTKLPNEPTVVLPSAVYAGLTVSREVTVPSVGSHDFARTIDSFKNSTTNSITATIRIVGNLGSDAATTVFNTSDGDSTPESTDQWIGTDDGDGTGSPAVIHYIHGSNGLQPEEVLVRGDNIEWIYSITVAPGDTLQLAHFTILATTRLAAINAANALITPTGFGGQATAFLSREESKSLANFIYYEPPTDIVLNNSTIVENAPPNSDVGTFGTVDADAGDQHTYALVPGDGAFDNAAFTIEAHYLRINASPDFEIKPSYTIRVRSTDSHGLWIEKIFVINVTNVVEADFGDAPSPYPTTIVQNGAHHEATGPRLGATRDVDSNGQPTSLADGDGADEDGVTFSTLMVGQIDASITVSVQNVANSLIGGKLDAWIDFNRDGTWGGPGEQIFDSKTVVPGNNLLTFSIPSYALAGSTYARFRLSSVGNLGVGGYAADGEVEDYLVDISAPTSSDGSGRFQFAAPIPIPLPFVETYPQLSTVYSADLNGDGTMDSLVAAFGTGQIAWQSNNGAGAFFARPVIDTLPGATSAIAADVDGDGRLDIIATSYNSNLVVWYRNLGAGSFGPRTVIDNAAMSVTKVYAADVNGDGRMDLLSASPGTGTAGGVIKLHLNDGQPSPGFTNLIVKSGLYAAYDVTAADMDGDGDMDILSASLGDNLGTSLGDNITYWYENNGALAFTPHLISIGAIGSYRVLAVDLDRDGDMDVVSASLTDNRIRWHENDGSQTFTPHSIDTRATGVRSIEVADLDGDGKVDILASLFGANSLVWYQSKGFGENLSFVRQTIDASIAAVHSAVATDVDGDGDLDVIAGAYTSGAIRWYQNAAPNYTANFNPPQVGQQNANLRVRVETGARVLDAWIDFNNDGSFDGVGENIATGKLLNLAGNNNVANNVFYDVPADAVSGKPLNARLILSTTGRLSSEDLTGDSQNFSVTIAAPDFSRMFTSGDQSLTHSSKSSSVATGDIDGDGDLDAFVAVPFGNHELWINNGGVFSLSSQQLTNSKGSTDVQLVDVDRDGDLDAFVTNDEEDHQVWYNTSGFFTHNFAFGFTIPNTSHSAGASLADLDGDGDVDVFVANSRGDHQLWLKNNGSSGYTLSPNRLPNTSPANSLSMGDVDGDGDLDAFVGVAFDLSLTVYNHQVWLNNGGVFSLSAQSLPNQSRSGSIVKLGDLDGDGDLDAFIAHSSVNHEVWTNNNGVFSLSAQTLSNSSWIADLNLADLDGDGDLDAFVATTRTGLIVNANHQVWINNSGVFSPNPQLLPHTWYASSASLGDFDGDHDLDAFVASSAQVQFDGIIPADHAIWMNINPDFGDAPNPYATRRADNGAGHDAKGPRLGVLRDTEDDAFAPATGLEDGDDDGVSLGIISNGFATTKVTVTATDVLPGNTFVNGWIDFNRDGDWDDVGEQVLYDVAVNEGANELVINVPAAATAGSSYARFRIVQGEGNATTPRGMAFTGEVEDYAITIYDGSIVVGLPSGNGVDELTLRQNGELIELFDNRSNAVLRSQPLAATSRVTINGANTEADKLTVDYAYGGFFALPQGVQFNGGTGVGDALVINGTGVSTFSYLSTGSAFGNASVMASDLAGSDIIQFTGVDALSILKAIDVDIVGALNVGNGSFTIDSIGFTSLGSTTTLTGGTITAAGGLVLSTGQTIVARGVIHAPLYSERGSTIQASGNLTLGDASALDGIELYGRLITGAFTITLNDGYKAILGSQTTLGTSTADGNLIAPGGIALGASQTLVGRGSISTPNSSFDNQGFVQANSTSLTFNHLVTGAGRFAGNVIFNGGTSFGNSPALTNIAGNAVFTSNNTAVVEIGGLNAGSGYDKVVATGTISLAGNLDVRFISLGNAYIAKVGDSFELYSAASITGSFAQIAYPPLPSGLAWRLKYSSTAVTLIVVPQFAPTVISAEINGDGSQRQRSMVQSIKLTFGSIVNLQPGAIDVRMIQGVSVNNGTPTDLNTSVPLRPLEISVVNGRTVVIVRFADASGNLLQSLNDGKYQLKINSSLVTDSLNDMTLDGDADGVMGGQYTYREVDNVTLQSVDSFFRLYGDQDGDRDVDNLDLGAFRTSLNKSVNQSGYLWYFDFDSNGLINTADLSAFNLRKTSTIRR